MYTSVLTMQAFAAVQALTIHDRRHAMQHAFELNYGGRELHLLERLGLTMTPVTRLYCAISEGDELLIEQLLREEIFSANDLAEGMNLARVYDRRRAAEMLIDAGVPAITLIMANGQPCRLMQKVCSRQRIQEAVDLWAVRQIQSI